MINLISTSDAISLVSSAAGSLDVHASWMDNAAGTVSPGRTNTAAITTATTTTIVGSPSANVQRNIKFLSVRNIHATVVNTVTIRQTDGTLTKELYKATLQAGESIVWDDDGPEIYLVNGSRKGNDNTNVAITGGSITGTDITTIAGGTSGSGFTLTSGTLATSPVSGDFENDSVVQYLTPISLERGVIQSKQSITQQGGTRTLVSQTAAQKMFATPTNGALTVGGSRTYRFECAFSLSSMSATSGSFGFAIGGTATLTSIYWISEASKPAAALTTAAAAVNTVNATASNATLATASTGVVGFARIRGLIRVNGGGTIIPQISLGVAAAAVVAQDSYFECWPMGTNTVVSVGNWS
jgi:hypothetical protein